jgi:hypothetical protein
LTKAERLKAAWPFGQKFPSSGSKHNVHTSPKFLTRTFGDLAISNLFCVLAHQPNLRPHSARQATQPFAPFPILPEVSNFASPPAEPEDFLWINGISSLHLRDAAVKTSALTAAKKWDGSQDAFPIMFILSNCAPRLASAVTFADLGLTPARLGTTSQL